MFTIWAVLLTPVSGDHLVSGLIQEGFTVKNFGTMTHTVTEMSCVTALRIWRERNDTPADIYALVGKILTDRHWYALVISRDDGPATWCGSNIPMPVRKGKLKLVKPPGPKTDLERLTEDDPDDDAS